MSSEGRDLSSLVLRDRSVFAHYMVNAFFIEETDSAELFTIVLKHPRCTSSPRMILDRKR